MASHRTKKTLEKFVENGGTSVSAAMRDAGFSDAYAKNPQKLTDSDTWKNLIEKALPDELLTDTHKNLLQAHRIDHMVFPMTLPDEEVNQLLEEVNCRVRKIRVLANQKHVWFWSPDNKAKKEALDMAYKLKGRYGLAGAGDLFRPVQILIINNATRDKDSGTPPQAV